MPTKPINKGFLAYRGLFKLNRTRWLTRQIIEYTVDPFNLVDDPTHNLLQHIPRNIRSFRSHKVDRTYRTQCHSVIVGSLVTHNTYGTHIGQCGKVLVDLCINTGFCDLLAVDGVGILHDLYLFFGNLTDDSDTKSRARERLTEYQVLWNAKLQTNFTNLILEQVTQRLDDLLEIYVIRQSTHIMVGFDHCGFTAKTGLYNVRVDGSLYKEVYSTDLLCFFFKDTDKFFTDNLTLCFRLFYSGELVIITLLGIDTDKVQVVRTVRTKYCLDFIAFVLTEQTVIYKYTGQLFTDGF